MWLMQMIFFPNSDLLGKFQVYIYTCMNCQVNKTYIEMTIYINCIYFFNFVEWIKSLWYLASNLHYKWTKGGRERERERERESERN
jgi:hypothetical protein